MLADYHTHTPLCHHATGLPVEYAAVAQQRGLEEIGFADHNPMPEKFDDWRMDLADLPRYFDLVTEAREKFAPFPVRLGMECDFIAGREAWIEELSAMADWDYLIGSVHYISPGWDVDNPKHLGRFKDRPVGEIWEMYWSAYTRCIASGLFDFVAHPDLVKKFGFRPEGDLRKYYEPAVAAAATHGVAIEVSTAGLRKHCAEIYPARGFLEMAREARVPIVINSDAHAPNEVALQFDEALALVREVGFGETARFEKRKRRMVRLEATSGPG